MSPERLAELRERYGRLPEIPVHWPPLTNREPLISAVTLNTEQYGWLRHDLMEMLDALEAVEIIETLARVEA